MDTAADAREYDAMDHAAVNAVFVDDLLTAISDWSLPWAERCRSQLPLPADEQKSPIQILDLGAGTAQIPIELARRNPDMHVTALDAAESMLRLARKNVAAAIPLPFRQGLGEGSSENFSDGRIHLILADAKNLPFASATYPIVISNSIIHHIAAPQSVLAEAIRVASPGGLLFHRDLSRPNNEAQLQHLVETYAGDATAYQRKLFADSLRAALSLDEIRDLVAILGFPPNTVQMTSDRHWTWSAIK
jgi:ubiquinone/menaquinone biosynthesis C-methylase UbiE